ncbi:MAG: RpiB/LacA/LacB family sugar-phosphate isomerase [Mollicutes bacterium]|nr:RpiB/LacA/LacB family sugar-phosphate isomerase [Mollicutes bacterium]
MKIYVASDHRGVDIEAKIIKYLKKNNKEAFGPVKKHNETDDYPDFAFEVAKNVLKDKDNLGVLICGTGIGMSIAANKVPGIRAARCLNIDDAFFSRNHNSANIICISSNSSFDEICKIVDTFINTKPAYEYKHLRRINKINNIEQGMHNEL